MPVQSLCAALGTAGQCLLLLLLTPVLLFVVAVQNKFAAVLLVPVEHFSTDQCVLLGCSR